STRLAAGRRLSNSQPDSSRARAFDEAGIGNGRWAHHPSTGGPDNGGLCSRRGSGSLLPKGHRKVIFKRAAAAFNISVSDAIHRAEGYRCSLSWLIEIRFSAIV